MKDWGLLGTFPFFGNKGLMGAALGQGYVRYLMRLHDWLKSHGIVLSRNERKIAALKDKHRGQRCFIIGSGPSLKISDLNKLKNEVTFACNKIYLAFECTEWRPTYYSVYDVLVAENNKEEINKLDLCNVFSMSVRKYFRKNSAIWINELTVPRICGEYQCMFSPDIVVGAYGGWTVIYLQMQVAYYMGIREVYLLGVDFSFNIPGKTGDICSSGEVLLCKGEINHFHKDYRKVGESWTVPLLDLQKKAFYKAKSFYENNGGKIINVSRKTDLDVFECDQLENIL
mgnify:CR=1 FL=1